MQTLLNGILRKISTKKNLLLLLLMITECSLGEAASVKKNINVADVDITSTTSDINKIDQKNSMLTRDRQNSIHANSLEIKESIANFTEEVMKGFSILKEKISSANFTDFLKEKAKELKKNAKTYLQSTNLKQLGEDARTLTLTLPQAGFFNSLLGVDASLGFANAFYLLFIGWPLLLVVVYVALIVAFPNRRSDNLFEKHLSVMTDNVSHMMHMAEDSFLNFMEDITEPQDSYVSGSSFHPAYAFPDPHDRQEVYYKPTAYYDEYGHHFDADAEYDYSYDDGNDGNQRFDAWGNPIENSPSFVSPNNHNTVSSIHLQPSEPLREQIQGDVTRLGGNFDLQNVIAQKDKHNFLNVVLGTQYQHSKPPGSLADQGIVQGTVGPDLDTHPEPPRGYQPSQTSSSPSTLRGGHIYFDADVDPRIKDHKINPSGFRPSKLQAPNTREEDWVAGPGPFKRIGEPADISAEILDTSTFILPDTGESRLRQRR